jgi:hypothetical protein
MFSLEGWRIRPVLGSSLNCSLKRNNVQYVAFFIFKKLKRKLNFLCPFAGYYLRYGVRPLFTISRSSFADDKRAGYKVQCKIAVAVQKVKSPVHFIPLFWNQRHKLSTIILFVLVIKLALEKRRRVWRGRDYRWRDRKGTDRRGRVWIDFSLFKPNLRNM